ncbi:hypothetical protein BOTBODRAFT_107033 [Botryobasidium botryosum FD-172 SS1]|uniref:Uncharacterized protein n=1 Tax=Botryobasidium botryosum (strain FD-172 SS1) TaxID=930990 RepID=A0A067MYG6_BOTB1|nr:hypothetical protein BOTBODRAFT_107033 [Botryobasidium botryosum FD-172 SS1]
MATRYHKDLDYLRLLLQNLLGSVVPPGSDHYRFNTLQGLDADWVEMTGTNAGALNHLLEVTFGRRDQGFIIFKERGPGLEGVVDTLRKYITGVDGENGLLLKWIDDLIGAAKEAYQQAGIDVPSITALAFGVTTTSGGTGSASGKKKGSKASKAAQRLEAGAATAQPEHVAIANKHLTSFSGDTLAESEIPKASAAIIEITLDLLRTYYHLMIGFDGGTTRRPQSIYTVTITIPDTREAFLMEGDEASGVSHTGEHLKDLILKVMDSVGRERFSGIVSDNTGNTKLARELVAQEIPTIIILADPCHHLNNTIKDICKIGHFKEVSICHSFLFSKCIKHPRKVTKHFRMSSYASTHLAATRRKLEIGQGLVSAGKTRFGSIYYSLKSVVRCLPPIRRLISTGLVSVLDPLAKAITCLESSHSTASDVYVFWIAIMATYQCDIFKDNSWGLPENVIEEIHRIINYRYNEMMTGPGKEVYITAFFLDPIIVRSQSERDDNDISQRIPSYRRIGTYLTALLMQEIIADSSPIFSTYDDAQDVRFTLHQQFAAYARQLHPFNRHRGEPAMDYWKKLKDDPDASILALLAIKLFSLVPNSMAEERTVSTFTRLNTKARACQKASTIVQMTRIQQHYKREKSKVR